VVLVGVDTLGDAPMVELFIRRAALTAGTRVIAVGPRRPAVSRYGVWLGCKPGTEASVIAGLLHLLARNKGVDASGKSDVEGWTKDYAPDRVAEMAGANAADLKQAAAWLAEKGHPLVLYGDGAALPPIRNLAALLGGEAAYLSPHPNAWGALLVGVAPDRYPGGASVEDAKAREGFGKRWDARPSPRKGISLNEMLAGAREGKVQAMLVVETDLASASADAAASLQTLRFLAVVDQFLTPTAELADVVLPSAATAEMDGTYLNLARRLQLSRGAALPPKGARPAWKVIADLAEISHDEGKRRTKDGQWEYEGAAAVWREITRGVTLCRECTYDSIGAGGWQPETAPEKARLAPFTVELPIAQEGYPLALAAGRALFRNGVPLAQSAAIAPVAQDGLLLVHPQDAEPRGLKTGDTATLSSPRGSLSLKAQVSQDVVPGCVWAVLDAVAPILEAPGKVTRVKLSRS
jgi:predicted molibdopterin-dependent oxidoreductase YjgC